MQKCVEFGPHLNTPDGEGISWVAANECGFIRFDVFGIRSTSGVDSRPSGLISVHSTFESRVRPHRTCYSWPPHFQGVVEARSQPQVECTQKICATRNAPTTLSCQCHPACSTFRKMLRGSRCSCALVDYAAPGPGPAAPRAVRSAALPKPSEFNMSQSQLKSPRAAG